MIPNWRYWLIAVMIPTAAVLYHALYPSAWRFVIFAVFGAAFEALLGPYRKKLIEVDRKDKA